VLFVYDGWNLVKETTIPDGGSAVDKYYVWGLDLSQSLQGAGGVGGLLAAVDDSLTYHYLYDANGNVGQVIKADDGSIAAHYEYDPFGNLVNQAGDYADENPYRFSTKYFDTETNLYYYGYRYYSAELGRWINRDPIGEEGDQNIHVFIRNNGVNNYDYLGEYTLDGVLAEYCVAKYPSRGSAQMHTCMTTTSAQKVFELWYQKENTQLGWWKNLPKCPRKLCKGTDGEWEKPSKEPEKWNEPERPPRAEALLHPGAKWSLRSKPDPNKHANQCIYDDQGVLELNPPTAGTVDWHKVRKLDFVHWLHDVEPIDLADYLDWGGGDPRQKRGFFHDIALTVIGTGKQINNALGPNMSKYYEVRPLYAESE
jgi:RHS repeat-associated protein